MIDEPLWRLAGWTMIHFLWVGAAVAIATLALRFTLRSAAPLARYSATLIGFLALTAAPAVIAGYLWQAHAAEYQREPVAAPPPLATTASEPPVEPRAPLPTIDLAVTPLEVESFTPAMPQPEPVTGQPAFSDPATSDQLASEPTVSDPAIGQPVEQAAPAQPPVTPLAAEPAALDAISQPGSAIDWRALLDRAARWLPLFWLIGAPVTFLLLATGLIGVERLRRDCRPVTDGPLHDAFLSAANKLRVTGRAALALSTRVAQPVLVGVARPLVLLPASAAVGWTPEQLEMVLLHELAHARRWDNLVNLLQRAVESLLFFHPAVWLVSRALRADREQCCDALVVRHTRDPRAYAELLVAVAEQTANRRLPLAATAMAAHPLTRRVRRILQLEDEPMLVSRKLLAAMTAAALGLTLACGYSFSQDAEAAADGAQEVASEQPDANQEAPAEEAAANDPEPANPHFLSLEDQRAADLAYGMLGIEVAKLPEELQQIVAEKGFAGGVVVTRGGGFVPEFYQDVNKYGPFKEEDILVGLHIWPIKSYEQLPEVLRRGDLDEFRPLKFYLLRSSVDSQAVKEVRAQHYELVTGRIEFNTSAWQKEQARLARQNDPNRARIAATGRDPFGRDPFGGIAATGRDPFGANRAAVEAEQAPEPDAAAEANPDAKPPLSQLKYNGRTFAEWNAQWRTELSEEKRVEAVNAIAAFGHGGYGEEAVGAILEIVPVVPVTAQMQDALQKVFVGALAVPADVWRPLLAEKVKSQPEVYGPFAGRMLRYPNMGGPGFTGYLNDLFQVDQLELRRGILDAIRGVDPILSDPNVVVTVRQALKSDDEQVVRQALAGVQRAFSINSDAAGPNYAAAVYELLLHTSSEVREGARGVVAEIPPPKTSKDLIAKILETLDDPHSRRFFQGADSVLPAENAQQAAMIRLALVRTLATIGPAAGAARQQLQEYVDSADQELAWVSAIALDMLDNRKVDGSALDGYYRVLTRFSDRVLPGVDLSNRDSVEKNRETNFKTIYESIAKELRSLPVANRNNEANNAAGDAANTIQEELSDRARAERDSVSPIGRKGPPPGTRRYA